MWKKGLLIFLVLTLTMGLAVQAFAGSIELNVNGQSVTKDLSAQVVLGKVFVPLKYVTEKVGGEYNWNNTERRAAVTVSGNTSTMKVGEPFVKINGVPRLIDFPSYTLDGQLMVTLDAVERIFNVHTGWDKAKSVINITEKKAELNNIKINKLSGEAQIVIGSSKPVSGTSKYLADNRQIIVEIPNAVNKIGKDKIEVNDDLIKEINVDSSVLHGNTKITISLQKAVEHRLEQGAQVNQLLLTIAELGRGTIPDSQPGEKEQAKLVDISFNSLPDRDQIFFQMNGQAVASPVKKLVSPDRLVLDFSNTRLSLSSNSMPVNDEIIKQIRAGQFTNDIARVVVDLNKKDAKYIFSPDLSGSSFLLQIAKTPNPDWGNPNLLGKVIVIDPGHGGSDPGAIGPSGVREKDVVLPVAKKLHDLLLEAGAQPIMTRDRDVFVSLLERSQIANRNNADLFVSIHANASGNYTARGTETYSYIYSNSPEGAKLAKSVQANLVRQLGLPDRGIRTDNFSVLRNTKAPSILAELAFISNPSEEKILADPAYQQRSAEALMQGIVDYYQQK